MVSDTTKLYYCYYYYIIVLKKIDKSNKLPEIQ